MNRTLSVPFYVVCGCDGTGKTSTIQKIKNLHPNKYTYTQEPFDILYKSALSITTDPYEQALIFSADRANHYINLLSKSDKPILCDRYNYCNYVYQSLDMEKHYNIPVDDAIKWLEKIQPFTPSPDKVIYLHCSPEVAYKRITNRGEVTTLNSIQSIMSRYEYVFNYFNIDPIIIDTTTLSHNQVVNTLFDILIGRITNTEDNSGTLP